MDPSKNAGRLRLHAGKFLVASSRGQFTSAKTIPGLPVETEYVMCEQLFGIKTYIVVQVVALSLFVTLCVFLFSRAGIRLKHAAAIGLLYVVCNFVIAKVLCDYVRADGRHTVFEHPSVYHFLEEGFWGWPIAFFPCVLLYPFVTRLRAVPLYRAMALLLPPVFAVQKVACFSAGCCRGCETALPWSVIFPDDLHRVPCHPLQLYDAVLPLVVLGVLLLVDRRGGERARPFLLPLLMGLYGLTRFGTEFMRQREGSEVLLLSQCLELGVVTGVIVLLTVGRGVWRDVVCAGSN